MIFRARHLREARLFECYLAERQGETIDPPAAEHLADCAACGSRYAELTRFMDTLRAEAEGEADDVFTTERLRAQQQHIARRLEAMARPARVISFPGQAVRRSFASSATRTAPRWAAAAAAAGLFIGIALGASYQWDAHIRGGAPSVARGGAGSRAAGQLAPVATRGSDKSDVPTDDAFLSDLEIALERPHTRELMAIDAFTPHFREIRNTP